MAPRCRPPYEEQNARISILVNGIAGRPDTFVQTVLGQPQKPLADGAGHTFSATCRAMRLDMRTVDRSPAEQGCTAGHSLKHVQPNALTAPAIEAFVDRRIRAVFGR